jgi:hypothetical protein
MYGLQEVLKEIKEIQDFKEQQVKTGKTELILKFNYVHSYLLALHLTSYI